MPRIPGIQYLAQRKRRWGTACDTQTLAALVAVSLEIPSAPLLKNVKWRRTKRMVRARVIRITYVEGWNLYGVQFARPRI